MDVFHEIACLTERSKQLKGIDLQRKWFKKADRRAPGLSLQKFISYNSEQFEFLGVQPSIIGADKDVALEFRSSCCIGAIPLRAPDTGKQIGDFVVTPRYSERDKFEEYVAVLDLLGNEISPEFADSLPLASGKVFRPPLYLEAVKFVTALERLVMKSWRKFDNVEKTSNQPIGQVNWSKYIRNEYKVENRLKFPVRANVSSEFHTEYSEVRYVFDICKTELLSANTPQRIKGNLRNKLNFIEQRLYHHKPKVTSQIAIKFSDSPAVKACKEQANKILNFNLVDGTAWRVDFSDVFEKFVQYIFKEVAKETGGNLYSNHKLHSKTAKHYSWQLNYLEPDAIFRKDNALIFIDAKYKSNLYNSTSQSAALKEDHRHDLHQIMAYSSFSNASHKLGLLCYPSNKVELKKIKYQNTINGTITEISVLGIPLKTESIAKTKALLIKIINEISSHTKYA